MDDRNKKRAAKPHVVSHSRVVCPAQVPSDEDSDTDSDSSEDYHYSSPGAALNEHDIQENEEIYEKMLQDKA